MVPLYEEVVEIKHRDDDIQQRVERVVACDERGER
jgi:hypothetical protein